MYPADYVTCPQGSYGTLLASQYAAMSPAYHASDAIRPNLLNDSKCRWRIDHSLGLARLGLDSSPRLHCCLSCGLCRFAPMEESWSKFGSKQVLRLCRVTAVCPLLCQMAGCRSLLMNSTPCREPGRCCSWVELQGLPCLADRYLGSGDCTLMRHRWPSHLFFTSHNDLRSCQSEPKNFLLPFRKRRGAQDLCHRGCKRTLVSAGL